MNYEGGWGSQNPAHIQANAASRYMHPQNGDFSNKKPLEDAAAQTFKDWNMRHPRAGVMQKIDEKRDTLTSFPVMEDKVFGSIVIMGAGYAILRNGFNFSPGISMTVAGFVGYTFYEGSDTFILRSVFDRLKN